MKKFFVLVLALSLISQAQEKTRVNAQPDSAKVYQLKEVIVTATRTEKNPVDVGRSVTVISNDQLRNSMYQSVAEVLSQQEGMYIVGTGQNMGAFQSLFMRGAGSNQTAILVDDIRITDPSSTNNALDISELSFAGVDRVELVRGSHSTLYGSSAIGGVMNIITQKNRAPGLHADAEVRSGIFGQGTSLFSENLFLNYTHPTGLYFNAEISNANVKGLDATVDTVTNPNAFKNRDKDGFVKQDMVGKVGFKDDAFDIYASYKRTYQKVDLDKSAYRDDDNYTIDFKRNLLTYGAAYQVSKNVNVKYLGGFSDMQRYAVDDSSVVDRLGNNDHTFSDGIYKGTMATNELQATLRMNGFDAVVGAGLYKETMTSKTYFYTRSSYGVYESRTDLDALGLEAQTKNIFAHVDVNGALVSDELNRVSLAAGARSNSHSTFGASTTFEINPSVKVTDNALLFASYSTGFNAPSLYQLFAPSKDYTSGITRGNKNLQPETSSSYEIGFKQSMGGSTFFTVSYFNTIVKNSIAYVYLWDKNVPVADLGNDFMRNDYRGDTYLNIGKQATKGFEISFTSIVNEQISFSGNMSILSGVLNYSPSDIDNAQTGGHHVQSYNNGAFINKDVESLGLTRRPNTANLSFHYKPLANLAFRLDMRYAGARDDIYYDSQRGPYGALGTVPVADYVLIDISQRYVVDNHFSINVRVENVFDTKYAEINGFSTRGRGLYISLKYLFEQSF